MRKTALKLLVPTVVFAAASLSLAPANEAPPGFWPAEKAREWYEGRPLPVGANFTPSTAVNQLEFWQAGTFDPETIDRELGWAAALGMNTMRVYLHDLAWQQDPDGFRRVTSPPRNP